ncbi:hypothetical protein FG080_18650, partial [Vibrio cholerae]|nr:hypothetical protein [Vibrio cholerae]
PNARLRGWQRITTKLKHNNRNHRGSMELETPRVGSPFEAFVSLLCAHSLQKKHLFSSSSFSKTLRLYLSKIDDAAWPL